MLLVDDICMKEGRDHGKVEEQVQYKHGDVKGRFWLAVCGCKGCSFGCGSWCLAKGAGEKEEPLDRIELSIFSLQGKCVSHCATKASHSCCISDQK